VKERGIIFIIVAINAVYALFLRARGELSHVDTIIVSCLIIQALTLYCIYDEMKSEKDDTKSTKKVSRRDD